MDITEEDTGIDQETQEAIAIDRAKGDFAFQKTISLMQVTG